MTPGTANPIQGPAALPQSHFSFVYRLICLAVLLIAELLAFSLHFDTQAIDGKPGLIGILADDGPVAVDALLAFAAFFVALSYAKAKRAIQNAPVDIFNPALNGLFLAGHFVGLAGFFFLTSAIFESRLSGDVLVLVWTILGMLETALALVAFIPPKLCIYLLQATGLSWLYAATGALASAFLISASRLLWTPATEMTFRAVQLLWGAFRSDLVVEPATKTIGTSVFRVTIAPGCSGLEGLGLMLAFSMVWLWISREELVVRRALLAVPFVIAVMFPLNILRITALLLIGNAGAPNVATGGFHSQAGWIAFNAVAIGFCFAANRVSWLWKRERVAEKQPVTQSNPTAAYLIPFLAILAASMISRATQADFEWLYPLRFAASAGALILLRREYRNLNWRFGLIAPVLGGLVFALWLGLDRFAAVPATNGIAAGLAALSAPTRVLWLTFRVLTAVAIVPIAEELAFRGYLCRRITRSPFESVSFQRYSWIAILISSLAFGAMHGPRWIAGTVAGILYALAAKRHGRIGDAVVAHGVTNALIAVWVLVGGHWSLW